MTPYIWLTSLMLLFAACGEDGEGGDDSLFTGFSLVVVIIIGFFVVRWLVGRNRG